MYGYNVDVLFYFFSIRISHCLCSPHVSFRPSGQPAHFAQARFAPSHSVAVSIFARWRGVCVCVRVCMYGVLAFRKINVKNKLRRTAYKISRIEAAKRRKTDSTQPERRSNSKQNEPSEKPKRNSTNTTEMTKAVVLSRFCIHMQCIMYNILSANRLQLIQGG